MTNNELFINATRANYQFPFRGMINVIDLWDLSLTNLDSVFKTLNAESKKSEEESLLNTKSKEDEEVSNKIEIVKYIVSVKLDEKKKREDAYQSKSRSFCKSRCRIERVYATRYFISWNRC